MNRLSNDHPDLPSGFFDSLFKRSVSSRFGIPCSDPISQQVSTVRSIEAQLLYTLVDNYDMYQRHVVPSVAKRMLLALRDTVDELIADIDNNTSMLSHPLAPKSDSNAIK